VTHNNEIWDRCKAKWCYPGQSFNQLNENQVLNFKRVCFNVVTAMTAQTHTGRSVVFRGQASDQTKAFAVTCFPDPLLTIVIPTLGEDGVLDYMEYLIRSFILHEHILLPFLAILKDHLEEFQIFLGSIESWLMDSNASFIQKMFNVKLELGGRVISNCELKTIPSNDKSTYNISFDVSNDKGLKKLSKFLALLTDVD